MRLFVSGSAPLSAETHKEFEARTGHAILERYGMTETNMNTSNPYDGERVAGTVGFPLPGVEVRVADPETGRELPRGEVGMIEVRGPNVFKGYWRMPEKTAAEFRAGRLLRHRRPRPLSTSAATSRIVGRAKDLIISGGFNVYPKEVEERDRRAARRGRVRGDRRAAPRFRRGAWSPSSSPGRGPTLDERRDQAALAGELAKYKLPKRVFFVDELPRNAMGKVQKKDLRERHKDTFAAAAP